MCSLQCPLLEMDTPGPVDPRSYGSAVGAFLFCTCCKGNLLRSCVHKLQRHAIQTLMDFGKHDRKESRRTGRSHKGPGGGAFQSEWGAAHGVGGSGELNGGLSMGWGDRGN